MASSDGTGKVYFTKEEWTEFVMEMAPFLNHTQFALGPVNQTEDGFEVDYAFGDEVHPKDWVSPPWWVKKDVK